MVDGLVKKQDVIDNMKLIWFDSYEEYKKAVKMIEELPDIAALYHTEG